MSCDGTWQRHGCITAISINTGKVLDCETLSQFCRICNKLSKMSKDLMYEKEKVEDICSKNHVGLSASMESVGVKRIFEQSQTLRGLQYSDYYGDGDSKGHLSVQNIYGENSVKKLECIGHIQKRVGTRLHKLKKKTSQLKGKGLTDLFIDKLQKYYGIAILC